MKQTGASFIYREGNARYLTIELSVRGRDLESTIADANARIAERVQLPPGYRLEWAGELVLPAAYLLVHRFAEARAAHRTTPVTNPAFVTLK